MTEEEEWENSIKELDTAKPKFSEHVPDFLDRLLDAGYKKGWATGFILITLGLFLYCAAFMEEPASASKGEVFLALVFALLIFQIGIIFLPIIAAGGVTSLPEFFRHPEQIGGVLIMAAVSLLTLPLTWFVGALFLASISTLISRIRTRIRMKGRKLDSQDVRYRQPAKKELILKSDLERVAEEREDQLEELEEQLDKGIITQEEFDRKKVEIKEEYERKMKLLQDSMKDSKINLRGLGLLQN